jgi:hypothetical protein
LAIFELVVPPVILCDAHRIVAENTLNLPNRFLLAITKLLAKFDAIPLIESFCHFCRNNNAMHAAYTLSLTRWLHMTDAVCWREKIHVCA